MTLEASASDNLPIEQAVIGARRPERERAETGHQHEGGGEDADALAHAELFPNFNELCAEF